MKAKEEQTKEDILEFMVIVIDSKWDPDIIICNKNVVLNSKRMQIEIPL